MVKQDNKKVYYDLIYLVSCALTDKTPSLENIDLDAIKEEATKDSILPMTGKVVPQFYEEFCKNVYRNTNFENCREKLYSFFDNKSIFHCSLKGMVTKDLYPHFDMRMLADYDVWFDPTAKEKVRKWYKDNNVKVLYLREIRKR